MKKPTETTRISELLKELHLPGMRDSFEQKAQEALQEQSDPMTYLRELLELEWTQRREKSVAQVEGVQPSSGKKLRYFRPWSVQPQGCQPNQGVAGRRLFRPARECSGFRQSRRGQIPSACHPRAGVGQGGSADLFSSTSMLVQELLRAKAELRLDKYLNKLAVFDAVILDDIGYVQQDRLEMEVLFTLLSARYERGSVMLTSNLQFFKWEAIFKDPMTTAAAIDRLVHHSVILELNVQSYRMVQAKEKNRKSPKEKSVENATST
jgi:hypothetical protein